MTNSELSKMIKKYLIPLLGDQYSIKNNIVYKTPVSDILLGFCFERTANDKSAFYLSVFAQPLYVPSEDFILTFGIRLNRRKTKSEKWDSSKEVFEELASVVKTEGLGFLENVSKPDKFCEFLKKDKSGSVRVTEAMVYSEFYCEMPEADKDAMFLLKHIREKEDLSIGWIKEIQDNTERLLMSKKNSKEKTQAILQEWKDSSIKNLKI
ncbi:MAG: hypothetical protein ACKVOQ_04970 [Cyclobacteriaceae bacterium]